MNCIYCGGELCWDSDGNTDEVSSLHDNDKEAVVSFYTCTRCGRSYEICDLVKEERETIYKEYWHDYSREKKRKRHLSE